uniref:Peptidase S1 domain-containing protein n=1 Tax=Chelonoidis abingdonii TaxID=106734 RepID=A0A8C0JAY3_CHEAB
MWCYVQLFPRCSTSEVAAFLLCDSNYNNDFLPNVSSSSRSQPLTRYSVSLGRFQLNIQNANAFTSAVSQLIIHSDYNPISFASDIALVHLFTPVLYTAYILPVCLPDRNDSIANGTLCWVTGWGDIQTSGKTLPAPRTLQEVQVPLIDVEMCNDLYSKPITGSPGSRPVKDGMVCAGYPEGGKDSCQGDSGGPLVCSQAGSWFLIGIVSWGDGCALPYRPGVYTRVSAYSDWIQQQLPSVESGVVNLWEGSGVWVGAGGGAGTQDSWLLSLAQQIPCMTLSKS